MTVYIPTKNRHENLRKIIPRWAEQGIPIRLVVDNDEVASYRAIVYGNRAIRVVPVKPGQGMGYIRNYIVRHAHRNGLESIIFSEDDVIPDRSSNFRGLLNYAKRLEVLGIGATQPIHDLFTGGLVSKLNGPILCPGGWGFILFALNINNAIKLGNYDPQLYADGDDAELARCGIKNGFPWLVHCGVRYSPLGKRYTEGGVAAMFKEDKEARLRAEQECRAIIHSRWPKYVSAPGKRYRQSWQKMLDDYIPGWRSLSAIHGGHL